MFTVLGGQVVDNANATIKLSTAPNTWYVKAAVNRCFNAWKAQRSKTLQNAELENSEQNVGKFADFKISLNGASNSLTRLPIWTDDPAGALGTLAGASEWATASVTDEAGTEKHFMIVGNHGSFYSATKGWLETRATPNDVAEPDMPDLNSDGTLDYKVDFLNNLNETADGQPERLELVYEDNDGAPYAVNQIYGDYDDPYNLQLQSMVYLQGLPPNGSKTEQMIAGFKAVCGLIHIHVASGSSPVLFLDVMNTPEAF